MCTNLASISNETGVGGAYCHVNHPVLAQLLDGSGHKSLLHLELSFAEDTSHLTNESLTLVQTQLVILVAIRESEQIVRAPLTPLLPYLPQA